VSRVTLLLLGLWLPLIGCAQSADLKPVVWDGFAYPYRAGEKDICNAELNPSCAIFSDQSYDERFWTKIEAIKDNNYRFVSRAEGKGNSLHVAVSVGLEWTLRGEAGESDLYYFCATVLVYQAGRTLSLVNSRPICWQKRLTQQEKTDRVKFLANFIYADPSETAQTVEKRLLAEIADIITSKPDSLVRLQVNAVKAHPDIYKDDPSKREMLSTFASEVLSAASSEALGRPIIPPATSTGLMDLRFADGARKSQISLPKSSHTIDLSIYPFVKDVFKDSLGLKFDRVVVFIRLNQQFRDGTSYVSNINFGKSSVPRRAYDDLPPELDELKNLNILYQLINETSAQVSKPNKEWLKAHVIKSSPDKVFEGFSLLAGELK